MKIGVLFLTLGVSSYFSRFYREGRLGSTNTNGLLTKEVLVSSVSKNTETRDTKNPAYPVYGYEKKYAKVILKDMVVRHHRRALVQMVNNLMSGGGGAAIWERKITKIYSLAVAFVPKVVTKF